MPMLDGFAGMHDGWGWLAGGAIMVLAWGSIIWGAIYFWRATERQAGARRDDRADLGAIGILRERFARGEITEEELTARLSALRRADQHHGRAP